MSRNRTPRFIKHSHQKLKTCKAIRTLGFAQSLSLLFAPFFQMTLMWRLAATQAFSGTIKTIESDLSLMPISFATQENTRAKVGNSGKKKNNIQTSLLSSSWKCGVKVTCSPHSWKSSHNINAWAQKSMFNLMSLQICSSDTV